MAASKIAISIDVHALEQVDHLVKGGVYPSRSNLIQSAVAEKLERLNRSRLARECAKLDPAREQAEAEEILVGEAAWPEY